MTNGTNSILEASSSESEDEKKRNALVMVLERAVGAELEGNIDEVKNDRLLMLGT